MARAPRSGIAEMEADIAPALQDPAEKHMTRGAAALAVPEERLRTIYQAMACGVVVWSASAEIVEANEAAEQILGASFGQLRRHDASRPPYELTRLDGAVLPREQWPVAVALRTGRAQRNVLVGLIRPDGQRRFLQIDAVPVHADDGAVAQVVVSFIDVTARRQAEERVQAGERRYHDLVENAHDAIFTHDLTGQFTSFNRSAERITGYTREEAIRLNVADMVAPEYLELARQVFAHKAADGGAITYEVEILAKDGHRVALEVSSRLLYDDGTATGVQGIARDITQRRQTEEALRHQALHDALTGLPNRILLHDRVQQAILAGQRLPTTGETPHYLALLLLDLDRFKEVNDTFGHDHGDRLLRQVAVRLCAALRATDTVARLGGDEFAVLLPRDDRAGAVFAAEKICAALDTPFMVEGQALHIAGSIGIVVCPEHGADPKTLLRRADVAMYVAKRRGACHAVYAAEQDEYSPDRLALTGALRHAIEHDALVLYYQPQVDVTTHHACCAEALVRWQHPQRGLILPDQFIPLAEQTGLIAPLAMWVLEAALRQCRRWQRAGLPLAVSVNLSTSNLHEPRLPDTIAGLLRRYELAPTCLRLEITESAIMADAARALEVLTRLAALGVRVSVDDFGTGYSSLAYLKRLPVEELKIDKSFVLHMAHDEADAAIVSSTISLGHSLGLQVVAEGVESGEIWQILASLGCHAVQGYYLSRPLPAAELSRWLRRAPWAATKAKTSCVSAVQERG